MNQKLNGVKRVDGYDGRGRPARLSSLMNRFSAGVIYGLPLLTCLTVWAFPMESILAQGEAKGKDDVQKAEKTEKVDVGGGSEVAAGDQNQELKRWVKDLQDDAYLVREQASLELWKRGEQALPLLREVAGGSDPEAVARARQLILYISAGVLFDSSEEVKTLVLKFSKSDLGNKLKILKNLTTLGKWKQVLHLAQLEPDPEIKSKMSDLVRATASRAAQDALVEGDLDLVSEILQLSGNDEKSMLVRAWFACQQGHFQQEMDKANQMPEEKAVLWRLALYRANGDLAGAMKEAAVAGHKELLAALQVLDGDAMPWLKVAADKGGQDSILSRGSQIQIARLMGDTPKADQLAGELTGLALNEESAFRVIAGLATNGYHKKALSILKQYDVEAAFDFYDSTESPQLALEVLGIPKGEKPPFTKWVKSFSDRVFDEENEDQYSRLLLVAGFLVRHGEGEHAMAVIEPLMNSLEEDGSDMWFELIKKMPLYQLGAQALVLLEKRGNEDGEADLGVRQLFDEGKAIEILWPVIKKRNHQDIAKSLHDIGLLSGIIADPQHETGALHQSLLDEVVDKPAAEKSVRQEALFAFAKKRHEIGVASGIVDQLVKGNEKWQRTKLFLDTMMQKWDLVEPTYEAQSKKVPGDYYNLLKWSMVLRKMGKEKKAEEILNRALLLTMGNTQVLGKLAMELSSFGYDDEAFQLWQRIAMMTDVGDSEYDRALVYLAMLSQPAKSEQQTWKKAAAISEVYAQFAMRGSGRSSLIGLLNVRFKADLFRAIDLLKLGERTKGVEMLDTCQKLTPGSGLLADDFFPVLRTLGVDDAYHRWFENSYRHVEAACEAYPHSANTHNTAAWLAARAVLRLDEALKHSQKALEISPTQGAYIDTMAEVWFSMGDRKKAVEWSEKAIVASISHAQGSPRSELAVLNNYFELHKQLNHFKNDPMPEPQR